MSALVLSFFRFKLVQSNLPTFLYFKYLYVFQLKWKGQKESMIFSLIIHPVYFQFTLDENVGI